MMLGFSVIDMMSDPALLEPWYRGASWGAWRAVLSASDGLPLTKAQRRRFEQLAGGRKPPTHRVRKIVAKVGRRGGKGSAAAAKITHAAITDHREFLRPGERATILALSTDKATARLLLSYVRAYFEQVDLLRSLVARQTLNGLELSNGNEIVIAPNNFRLIRGRSVALAILDEVAFWRDETSSTPDIETMRALVPALMTIPTSQVMILSSPYRKSGLLFSEYSAGYGRDDDDTLVVGGPSILFNPSLNEKQIEAEIAADPVAGASEWLAVFRDDVGAFLSREVVQAAVDVGVLSRPRLPGVQYQAFVDPSGASIDSFTCAVGHRETIGQVVVDLVWEKRPPFSPADACAELAGILREYGVTAIVGDRYAGGWVRDQFQRLGISYAHSQVDRSQLYLEAAPAFVSGNVRLVDSPRLVAQFCALERKTQPGGRDRVDHPAHRGARDDLSNAVAGVIRALSQQEPEILSVPPGDLSLSAPDGGAEAWRNYDAHGNRLAGVGPIWGRLSSDWSVPKWW
jgi:hypothetical protein